MASRTPPPASSVSAPPRPGPGPLGWATFLLAAFAAVASSLALFRSPGAAAPSTAAVADPRVDVQVSDLRSLVQDDFKKAVTKAEESLTRAERRLDETRASMQKMVEDGKRVAENAVRASSDHAETLDTKLRDATDATTRLANTVAALQATVKDLEARPVAARGGAVPAAPTPAAPTPTPTPTKPTPDEPPAGPTPEELAANKAKVAAAIADLASPEIAKVFPACVALGKFGDLEAVEPLLKVLREHKDAYARTAAASALGALRACDAVPTLLQALLDRDDRVTLSAAVAFGKIAAQDTGMTGSPTRKERNEARDKWSKWWTEHETEVRTRLGQPKDAGGGGEPAPK